MLETTFHIQVKKGYAADVIKDLQKMGAVEVLPDSAYQVPQWQMDEILSRKAYYLQHPEELIDWDNAQKMINL